jgi:peptidoglycan/LPS O-acetylase OafA/YrhL
LGSLSWRFGACLKPSPWLALVLLPLVVKFGMISDQPGAAYDTIWAAIGILCLAVSLPSLFAATRNVQWMNLLGELSYPFYLLHMAVLYTLFLQPWSLTAPLGTHLLGLGMWVGHGAITTSAVIVICLAVSALAHFAIERPFRRCLLSIFEQAFSRSIFETFSRKRGSSRQEMGATRGALAALRSHRSADCSGGASHPTPAKKAPRSSGTKHLFL